MIWMILVVSICDDWICANTGLAASKKIIEKNILLNLCNRIYVYWYKKTAICSIYIIKLSQSVLVFYFFNYIGRIERIG